jgi:hypothetical protein
LPTATLDHDHSGEEQPLWPAKRDTKATSLPCEISNSLRQCRERLGAERHAKTFAKIIASLGARLYLDPVSRVALRAPVEKAPSKFGDLLSPRNEGASHFDA